MSYPATERQRVLERKWGRDNVGQYNEERSMPANKLYPFRVLLDDLLRQYGTLAEVAKRIGLSTDRLWKFRAENYLTQRSARKILDGYHAIKRATP